MDIQNNYDQALWKQAEKRIAFKFHFMIYLVKNIFLWSFWYFTDAGNTDYWPVWTTLGWGLGVLLHYLKVYKRDDFFSVKKEYDKLKNKY